jgi:hypothetical protein
MLCTPSSSLRFALCVFDIILKIFRYRCLKFGKSKESGYGTKQNVEVEKKKKNKKKTIYFLITNHLVCTSNINGVTCTYEFKT